MVLLGRSARAEHNAASQACSILGQPGSHLLALETQAKLDHLLKIKVQANIPE